MRKKLLATILSIVMMLTLLPALPTYAAVDEVFDATVDLRGTPQDPADDISMTFKVLSEDISAGTGTVQIGNGNDSSILVNITGNINIPSTVVNNDTTYTVTTVGKYAFDSCAISSATIPEGVTTIGIAAFATCYNLTSISIPKSVTSIKSHAFSVCRDLVSITLPEGITSIETQTFYNCAALTSIIIPEGVTTIGTDAFKGCTWLSAVYFSQDKPTFENNAIPLSGPVVYYPSVAENWDHYSQDKSSMTSYNVNYDLVNATGESSKYYINYPPIYDSDFSAKLTANSGCTLPNNVVVEVGNSILSNGYSYSAQTGELVIEKGSINADITIRATAIKSVTDITMTNASSVEINENLTLSASVLPSDATNTNIDWTVKNANSTGATITNGVFSAQTSGTATITATITNGSGDGSNFTKDFDITITPAILSGNDQKINKGDTAMFKSSAEYRYLVEVKCDGTMLAKDRDYISSEGSTIIILSAAYINTLSVGDHVLEIVSETGTATANFTVANASTPTPAPATPTPATPTPAPATPTVAPATPTVAPVVPADTTVTSPKTGE